MATDLGYESLSKRYMDNKGNFSIFLARRIERALSWIDQAEKVGDENKDVGFLFLWIAFEALYGGKHADTEDWEKREEFFSAIVNFDDQEKKIYNTIFSQYDKNIRTLMNNKYTFHHFWKYRNDEINKDEYEEMFKRFNRSASRALSNRNTVKVISELFNRLYVLRNQIYHGGATWGSHRNRDSITDGWRILSMLVPVMLEIILDNPTIDLGKTYYHADDR